jgi:sec-independent protein translocase protein TatC
MATAIRTIKHEDRLNLLDHLEELRTRLIVCCVALGITFGVCLWQNHALLHIINRPLAKETVKQIEKGNGPLGQTALAQQGVLAVAAEVQAITAQLASPASKLPPAVRVTLAAEIPRLQAAVARIPRKPEGNKPVTLGIGEPFTTTLGVTLLFALVFSLPVILFEVYGFLLPAFSPSERGVALPLLAAIPVLFALGVLFGYFVALPASVRFFQNFNSSEFNVLVQAGPYYKFAATILLAMGLVFQVPVAVLAATRAGIVTPKQLRKNRRYALLACAAVAAFLPGDAITLLLETVPLYLLFEGSVLLASFVERGRPITASPQGGSPQGGSPQGSSPQGSSPQGSSPQGGEPPSDGTGGPPGGVW